jgi:2-succinyl-5-enolpyruvyl-6-hydroxy-3-cyclohexene-1-carboxylate synthase
MTNHRITKNQTLADKCIVRLLAQGVKDFIVCAGARNAPLVEALEKLEISNQISTKDFFEERSAAFFALGRSRLLKAPVAVLTTSGTAAAELLPAMIEAYYSGVPLVAVTADRPKIYRGSGAPQAIEQSNIFGIYAKSRCDWDFSECDSFEISKNGPSHLNICFEEPQSEEAPNKTAETSSFEKVRRPLVIVSEISHEQMDEVSQAILDWGVPTYLEANSQLRSHKELDALTIKGGAESLTATRMKRYFDGIIRIGSVPTLRLWRDLESSLSDFPVLSFSNKEFSGLARVKSQALPISDLCKYLGIRFLASDYFMEDEKMQLKLTRGLSEFPHSEPSSVREISRRIPKNSKVFLGNSLPIREWDLAAEDNHFSYSCNRGANGIDGLISTFLGEASEEKENWLILGDLSALYDLSSLWALRELPKAKIRILILNNGGGRIFTRVFANKKFENEHEIRFKSWAEMFKVEYFEKIPSVLPDRVIIEIRPDNEQTEKFWKFYEDSH